MPRRKPPGRRFPQAAAPGPPKEEEVWQVGWWNDDRPQRATANIGDRWALMRELGPRAYRCLVIAERPGWNGLP